MEERRGKPGYHIHLDELGAYFSLENCPLAASPQWIGNRPEFDLELSALLNREGIKVVLSGIGGDEFLGGIPNPRPLIADLIVTLRFIELTKPLMNWSIANR